MKWVHAEELCPSFKKFRVMRKDFIFTNLSSFYYYYFVIVGGGGGILAKLGGRVGKLFWMKPIRYLFPNYICCLGKNCE